MNQISEQMRYELQQAVLSLAPACPVDGCNPADCPLFGVRQLDPALRAQWFKSLTDGDLDFLTAYHNVCMKIIVESCSAKTCD